MTSKLNWFSPAPVGTWTEKVTASESRWLSIVFIGVLVLLIWGATVPELFVMCMFYLVMLGASFGAIILSYFASSNPFFSTFSAGNGERVGRGLMLGLILCFLMLIINGVVLRANFLQSYGIVDFKVVNLLLIILLIPFIEELFAGAFLTPTLAEKGGIVFSLVGNAFIFMTLHWVIFDASPNLLFVSACFRGAASSVQLYERSWTAGFFGHMFFNGLQAVPFAVWLGVF